MEKYIIIIEMIKRTVKSEYTDEIKNPALRPSVSTVDEKVGVVRGNVFKSMNVYKIANIA